MSKDLCCCSDLQGGYTVVQQPEQQLPKLHHILLLSGGKLEWSDQPCGVDYTVTGILQIY